MDIEQFLRSLIKATEERKLKWTRSGNDTFRASLSAGSVEIDGPQEPSSLRRELGKSALASLGDGVVTFGQFILGPVLKMFVPDGQPRVEWPVRRLTIRNGQDIVCRAEIDRESAAYMEISQLLFQVRTIAETEAAAPVLKAMIEEISKVAGDTELKPG